MEFFNTINGGQYPPFNNVVCNVDTDFVVKAIEQLVRAYLSSVVTAVVIGELREGKKLGPDRLVF